MNVKEILECLLVDFWLVGGGFWLVDGSDFWLNQKFIVRQTSFARLEPSTLVSGDRPAPIRRSQEPQPTHGCARPTLAAASTSDAHAKDVICGRPTRPGMSDVQCEDAATCTRL